MKLSDLPPSECRNLLWRILDRYHNAKERWPLGRGIRTEVHLTVDDARLMYAASQWLQRYSGWVTEAGGKVGVWPADFSLGHCTKFMTEIAASMDRETPIIVLIGRDMRILESAAYHLDHYHMLLEFEGGKKRRK